MKGKKHNSKDINLNVYSLHASADANADTAICILLREVFPATIWSDLNSSSTPTLNKETAIKIRAHVETKFGKILLSILKIS